MTETSKISINPDALIFAIHQAYQARSRVNGGFDSHLRYEPFLTNTWEIPQKPNFQNFKSYLNEVITHHYNILPNFQRNETVNIENISWFSHSIAALFADIEHLLTFFTGEKLPLFKSNAIPRAISSKNIALAIQKYSNHLQLKPAEEQVVFTLFPLMSESGENVDTVYVQEIWSLIASFIKKIYGSYFDFIQNYVLWKYALQELPNDVIDWNVRPPCGISYYKQFKELFDAEREERFAKRNEKNQKLKSQKDKSDNNHQDKKKHFENDTRYQKRDKPLRSEKEYPAKNSKFKSDEEWGNSPDLQQQKNLENALDEAKQAIKKMLSNVEITEINLMPQNSFVRRQQHSLITEAGFETESLGEAKTRHVCIKRKVT